MNLTSIQEDAGLIPGGLRISPTICGIGVKCSSDPALLWLWCRPAAAAPIQSLAQEISICHRCSTKKQNKTKTKTPTWLLKHSTESFAQCSNLCTLKPSNHNDIFIQSYVSSSAFEHNYNFIIKEKLYFKCEIP